MSRFPPPPLRNVGSERGKLRAEMPVENRDDEKTPTSIDSLPDDDLITILVKLGAQDIHDVGRLVCHRWNRLIRSPELIHSHLQCSPTGILLGFQTNNKIMCSFVGMSRGRIETFKLSYKFTGTVRSSCNGLVLLCDKVRHRLFAANPVTKQHFNIPQERNLLTCLGYVAATMEYKVVYVNKPNDCAILTVGVDESCRPLPTDHLSNPIHGIPLVTQGFVHWVTCFTMCLVTLNLETETISDIPLPQSLVWSRCFPAGICGVSFISVAHPGLCWQVWEMRPGPVVEWHKLKDINLGDKVDFFKKLGNCDLEPLGWIKYKEVLLFVVCGLCATFFAYNVCTREFELFELDFPSSTHSSYRYITHTNSLVKLDATYV